ncbi:hypothetical protein CA13_61570 [Planctomycetes bacterium CA13]|uniref:Uncharacterized protein n=1 Tax=Novipirellula herctigrandis TaxID=2527986 RepID=A0A5C5ZBZ9_9BACT|nr:hypothetical protein CA13_61570 [Planctomycetes bacterium CA13]
MTTLSSPCCSRIAWAKVVPQRLQCKTTIRRIKDRGRRWDFANAEYLMNIAALGASDLWEKYREIPAKIAA